MTYFLAEIKEFRPFLAQVVGSQAEPTPEHEATPLDEGLLGLGGVRLSPVLTPSPPLTEPPSLCPQRHLGSGRRVSGGARSAGESRQPAHVQTAATRARSGARTPAVRQRSLQGQCRSSEVTTRSVPSGGGHYKASAGGAGARQGGTRGRCVFQVSGGVTSGRRWCARNVIHLDGCSCAYSGSGMMFWRVLGELFGGCLVYILAGVGGCFGGCLAGRLDYPAAVTDSHTVSVPSLPVSVPVPSRPVPSRPVPSRPVPSRPVPSHPIPSHPFPFRSRPTVPSSRCWTNWAVSI